MVVDVIFLLEEKDVLVVWVGQGHGDFVHSRASYVFVVMLVALEVPPVCNMLLLVLQFLGPVLDVVKLELDRIIPFLHNTDDLLAFLEALRW